MSWHALIESIGSQIERESYDDLTVEAGELRDAELAGVSVHDRLRGAVGQVIEVATRLQSVSGRVLGTGSNWVLVESRGRGVMVPSEAICSVSGLGASAPLKSRFPVTLNVILRRLLGSQVSCRLINGTSVIGTISDVGADFVVVETEVREGRRARETRGYTFAECKNPASEVLLLLSSIDHIESGTLSDTWSRS